MLYERGFKGKSLVESAIRKRVLSISHAAYRHSGALSRALEKVGVL